MTLCYEENELRRAGLKFDFTTANASKFYLQHYENRLFLQFMLKAGNFTERQQAHKELDICDRKLEYWSRHPNFDQNVVSIGILKLQKDWSK